MVDNELQIKISADAKDAKAVFENIKSETANLDSQLSSVAKVSGVAFAALSAQVVTSLHAFAEAESASRTLTNALQNQGIFSEKLRDSYKSYAEEVSHVTGIQADEIVSAQAVAQGLIGQVPITKELTKAIADLAVQQGVSLPQAAAELGKAIGTGTGMLLRQGLQFSATDTEAQRYEKTLAFVQVRAGGFAQSANTGLGALKGLTAAFKDQEEELGARFAPAAEKVIKILTDFITPAKNSSGAMVDFKANLITIGLVLSGLGVAIPVVAQGFLAIRAAALALNVTLGATRLALAGLGIGLVVIALTELALHWEQVSARVKLATQGMVEFVAGAFSGLGKIFSGAFNLDTNKIKDGFLEIQKAFATGSAKAMSEIPKAEKKSLDEQLALKKQYADKENALRKEQDSIRTQLQLAEDALIKMQLENASAEAVNIQKQEIETLKALMQSKNAEQTELLKKHLAELQQLRDTQFLQDKQKQITYYQILDKLAEQHYVSAAQDRTEADKKQTDEIKDSIKTREQIQIDHDKAIIKAQVDAHNQMLEDERAYGEQSAQILAFTNSQGVKDTEKSMNDLIKMKNSKIGILKNIAKAAALAELAINTPRAVMSAFANAMAVPFIGPILAPIAAGAAAAFAAEQAADIIAAQKGGMVQGVGYGDTQPFMLEPGELVAPRQNFDEVVDSVAQQRGYKKTEDTSDGGMATVNIQLSGDLGKMVEAKIIERQRMGVSLFTTKLS